jgi:outer membrane lipopolysaccharide assembly protein LptE/RlpB
MRRLRIARSFLTVFLLFAAAGGGGCGYSLQGNLPDHLKTVSVPVFKNKTTEAGAESTITAAVINAFTSNGRLKVVSLDQADSVLDGEVTGYQVQSLTYDSRLNLRSYNLTVTMNVRFRDLRRPELLWQENGLVENVSFDVAGQVSDTISREEGAVKQAALEIGRKIVNRAVDRF